MNHLGTMVSSTTITLYILYILITAPQKIILHLCSLKKELNIEVGASIRAAQSKRASLDTFYMVV